MGVEVACWAVFWCGFLVLLHRAKRRGGTGPPQAPAPAIQHGNTAGWVYFIASDQDEAPIKIGMTQRDPRRGRLPELETMSPYPLRLIHALRTSNAARSEREIHEALKDYRLHGEWFDRDAVMMYIDHLKGAI